MTGDEFQGILDAAIQRVRDILVVKTDEYATEDDQLRNIRGMAMLQHETMPQAAAGAMSKHTISIYNMVESGKPYELKLWDEKITDHIVWLILLRATLIENANPDQERMPC